MNILKRMTVIVLSLAIVITMSVGFTSFAFAGDEATGTTGTTETSTGTATDVAENNLSAAEKVDTNRVKFSTTQVTWEQVDNAEGYVVTAKKKGSSKVSTKVVSESTDTDVAYTDLKTSTNYKYSVKAYKDVNGTKKYSSVKSTGYVVSGYVKSTARTAGSVSIKWSPITGAEKYTVKATRNGKIVKTKTVTSSKAKISGLSSSTKYRFTVSAYNEAGEATTSKSTIASTRSDYMWPVNGSVLSGYGYRTGYGSSFHEGIDISASTSTKVKAAKAGTVIRAGWYYGYGKTVMVSHGNGVVTLYGHLSSISVHSGQKVSQGKTLGRAGSTGSATCVHLHFEVQVNGSSRNPLNYLP